jgi:hypothetical protein
VALQGPLGLYNDRINTVPYSLYTFDQVLRIPASVEQPDLDHSILASEASAERLPSRKTGGIEIREP